MKKRTIIIPLVLVSLIGSGTFVYLNNKKINIQEQINLVLNDKKSNPSKKTTTETKTSDDGEDKDVHPTKTIDGDFETKELATMEDTQVVKDILNQLLADLKDKDVATVNNQYFIDGKADWLKYNVTTGYAFDFDSLKVHNTKKEYLLEWAIYMNKHSLKKRVVGTYDKNMKKLRLIEIK